MGLYQIQKFLNIRRNNQYNGEEFARYLSKEGLLWVMHQQIKINKHTSKQTTGPVKK